MSLCCSELHERAMGSAEVRDLVLEREAHWPAQQRGRLFAELLDGGL